MPRLDKLTIKAQEALQAAQEMGARSGQQQIEPLRVASHSLRRNREPNRPPGEGIGFIAAVFEPGNK